MLMVITWLIDVYPATVQVKLGNQEEHEQEPKNASQIEQDFIVSTSHIHHFCVTHSFTVLVQLHVSRYFISL